MLLVHYASKKACREAIGKPLRYTETSMFGAEYTPNGQFTVAFRPAYSNVKGREWFGKITLRDGLIVRVD